MGGRTSWGGGTFHGSPSLYYTILYSNHSIVGFHLPFLLIYYTILWTTYSLSYRLSAKKGLDIDDEMLYIDHVIRN
jgi:hypothetical protein